MGLIRVSNLSPYPLHILTELYIILLHTFILNFPFLKIKQTYIFRADNTADEHQADNINGSESESESSQRSSTGKDFEMVDQEDIES